MIIFAYTKRQKLHYSFIDIHTHGAHADDRIFRLQNQFAGQHSTYTGFCSVGIHPWYIDEDLDAQMDSLKKESLAGNVLAIGECGLDNLCPSPWDRQMDVFERQIAWANACRKPLIIHCVKAYQEALQLLKKATVPVIFHSFNKNPALAKQLLDRGYFLGLGGYMLQGAKDDLIRSIPLDRIFFETDDKSIDIVAIYAYFCKIRKISLHHLQDQVQVNFERIFNRIN